MAIESQQQEVGEGDEDEEQQQISASPKAAAQELSNSQAKDTEIIGTIKSIAEESLQISELSEMERTYSLEVIALLKQVIEPLNCAFHIRPTSLSKSDSSIQDVVLTPQGTVCIMHSHGTINSRQLDNFSTEILLRIINEVIPEAKRLLVEKRQKITGRVGSLEKIAKEFRKLPQQQQVGSSPRPGRSSSSASQSSSAVKSVMGQQATTATATTTQDALKASLITAR